MASTSQAIGFLGGRFDPVHMGHIHLALDALEFLKLEKVYFVPSVQTPLKTANPGASARDRLAMLELAIAGEDRLDTLTWELDQGKAVYTVDTARYVAEHWPNHGRYWIIGMDQLIQLDRWKDYLQLVDCLEFIVFERPGYDRENAPDLPGLKAHFLRGHYMDTSSTELRAQLAGGQISGLCLPEPVSQYIQSHKLYIE